MVHEVESLAAWLMGDQNDSSATARNSFAHFNDLCSIVTIEAYDERREAEELG